MTVKLSRIFHVLFILAGSAVPLTSLALEPDSNLPVYKKQSGIAGNLSSVGSDTLANLMTLWGEEYRKNYPAVTLSIQAAGSSTAPPALAEGTSNLGPMSRRMKSGEIASFEQMNGYKPTAIAVAIDALAVYVHRDNPIDKMTLAQVDAIFSVGRECGHSSDITTWDRLGLTGEWDGRTLQMYGRNSVSGTYGYFKKVALCKGDYKDKVNEQPGSASVVQGVANSINGVGYSGIGYQTADVKAVSLSRKKDAKNYIEPILSNVVTGKYPLSRYLYVYVNKHPERGVAPIVKEFLAMVLSSQGQQIVIKDGYISLPADHASKQMALLD